MTTFSIKYAAGETNVGEIAFEFELGAVKVNGQEVSAANAEWLVKYGCRKGFADSYAGKSGDEAIAEFSKRLDKMLNGTMTVRTGDARESLVYEYARAELTVAIGVKTGKPGMSESSARKQVGGTDKFNAIVKKFVDANRAAYESRADIELAARKNAVADVDADLLDAIDLAVADAEVATVALAESVEPKVELIKGKGKKAA